MAEKIFCPNCKKDAESRMIDSVEYIQCPECGWFQAQADGSMTACDPPAGIVDRPAEPGPGPPTPDNGPAATPEGGDTPPSGKPGRDDDDSDDSGLEIEISFED